MQFYRITNKHSTTVRSPESIGWRRYLNRLFCSWSNCSQCSVDSILFSWFELRASHRKNQQKNSKIFHLNNCFQLRLIDQTVNATKCGPFIHKFQQFHSNIVTFFSNFFFCHWFQLLMVCIFSANHFNAFYFEFGSFNFSIGWICLTKGKHKNIENNSTYLPVP